MNGNNLMDDAGFEDSLDGSPVMAQKENMKQMAENGAYKTPVWMDDNRNCTIPSEGNDGSEKVEGDADNITKPREQVGDIVSESGMHCEVQYPKVLEILYKRSFTDSAVSASEVYKEDEIQRYINSADHLHSKSSCVHFNLNSPSSIFAVAPSNSPCSGEYSRFDQLDPTILEFEYYEQLAINARNLKLSLAAQVLEKILPFFRLQNLLECRTVCKKWYDTISSSPYFWQRIYVTRRRGDKLTWTDLINSELCDVYNFPSYHIVECDLRESEVRLFVDIMGGQIKELKLTRCVYSVATLQNLLTKLHSLEYLEITGVDPSVLVSESIYPPNRDIKAINLKLSTLVLEYHVGRRDLQLEQSSVISFLPRNLSEAVLYDILSNSCYHLKIIKLIGWESRTCFNLLQLISYHLPSPTSPEELHFLNVPLKNLSFADFYPLANECNSLRLKKLSICLASNCWRRFPKVDTVYVDKIVTEILQVQSSSLTHVYLDHCPVSQKIFTVKMPKLKRASIHGTKISVADVCGSPSNFGAWGRGSVTIGVATRICEACADCSAQTLMNSIVRTFITLKFWGAACCCAILSYTIVFPDQPRLLLFLVGTLVFFASVNSNNQFQM